MKWVRLLNWPGIASLVLGGLLLGMTGCNLQGKMDWVQPTTTAPRVGEVYCIRGWKGIWSLGIDEMAKQLNEKGVTAHVFMPEQVHALAATLVQRYKNSPQHEPICFIGHSRGVDASLIIARELEKAGVSVDVIACLDSVDETTVPRNVRLCYNYWMPGIFLNTNILRGIPLKQEPGSTGQLFNYNCAKEYRSWRSDGTNHVNFDDDPKIQKRIVEQVLEACPERSKWVHSAPAHPASAPSVSAR
jgi:hypothetical protein